MTTASARGEDRLWELDLARTVAIGMMVAYHVGYDLKALAPDLPIDPFGGGWRALQVVTGSSFLLLVGVSAAISDERARARGARGVALLRRPLRRAGQVLAAAALVSLATRLALGEDYVRFGILHLIAVAMLVSPLVARLRGWAAPLGAAVIGFGLVLRDVPGDWPGALVVGLAVPGSAGVDRYPLLPWLGVVMIGVALGQWLYPRGGRGAAARRIFTPRPRGAVALGAPGRHALPIYLVHQPVLIPLIALLLAAMGRDVSGFR